MNNFKNFTEKISCRVIPTTRDRRVWLDEKVVDDDLYCVFMNGRSYELGEEYDDFLYVTADNFAELADVILRELYARGFSSSDYKLINENRVHLDYSFISDDTLWTAWRNVDAIVTGDITDEKDYRRDKTKRGRWMSYSELVQTIGKNQAHKIFEQLYSYKLVCNSLLNQYGYYKSIYCKIPTTFAIVLKVILFFCRGGGYYRSLAMSNV